VGRQKYIRPINARWCILVVGQLGVGAEKVELISSGVQSGALCPVRTRSVDQDSFTSLMCIGLEA